MLVRPMRSCVIVPAYQAALAVRGVVEGTLRALAPHGLTPKDLLVVDDGSTDATAEVARACGVRVVSHARNRGKGAALRTGLAESAQLGYQAAITVDADGQHLPSGACAVLEASGDPNDLVLGVRDLARAGAPRKNQLSNRFSNLVLSAFGGTPLADTQCGLRRYPIAATLALGCRAEGYAFEAEVVLRALAAGVRVIEVPVDVEYPPARTTHFDSVRDPARIVRAVLRTMVDVHVLRSAPRSVTRVGHGPASPADPRSAAAE